MEAFHYDDYAEIIVKNQIVSLSNLSKQSKTRTIYKNGWSIRINTKDIKIHPSTYQRIGRYDHQFDGYDFFCYLCLYAGTTPSKCKCKNEFTVEEHLENIKISRKNYLISVIQSSFANIYPFIENIELNNELVNKILYKKGKYGERLLSVYYPPAFDFRNDYKTTKSIEKHLINILKKENISLNHEDI